MREQVSLSVEVGWTLFRYFRFSQPLERLVGPLTTAFQLYRALQEERGRLWTGGCACAVLRSTVMGLAGVLIPPGDRAGLCPPWGSWIVWNEFELAGVGRASPAEAPQGQQASGSEDEVGQPGSGHRGQDAPPAEGDGQREEHPV